MAFAKNTRTGKIVSVPDHYIGHPILGKDLVVTNSDVTAAPKKEKKAKDYFTFETQEQPAPEINIENEEIEDGN